MNVILQVNHILLTMQTGDDSNKEGRTKGNPGGAADFLIQMIVELHHLPMQSNLSNFYNSSAASAFNISDSPILNSFNAMHLRLIRSFQYI